MARNILMITTAAVCIAVPAPAWAQAKSFNIPAQSAQSAVTALGRQGDIQIIAARRITQDKRANAVKGDMTVEQALDRLLKGTGLEYRQTGPRTYTVVRSRSAVDAGNDTGEDTDYGARPEILVVGERNWSLNTDIKRTRDDAQPYIIFDAEQIKRSGSSNLEDFFRDFLNASANPSINENNRTTHQAGTINLRGLGAGETLILVDGRRIAPINANNGEGRIEQPLLNGIPLNSIERIEVLASSASGIYGGSATGGVINIVLKRDYRGFEISANYGGSFDGGGTKRRIDASGGFTPWGGANVSVSGSWEKSGPLVFGQRDYLIDYGRRYAALAPATNAVLLGATPNIRSVNGSVLTFDACSAANTAAWCGQSLGSSFTHVPEGYRGIALDGAAGLIANAGTYNTEIADTTQTSLGGVWGGRAQIVNATENLSGMVAIRQEISPALKVFAEFAANRSAGTRATHAAASSIQLAATAPNNPFQQAVYVSILESGEPRYSSYRSVGLRATGGVIVNLPFDWQGSADYSWNRTDNRNEAPTNLTGAFQTALATTANVIRDQTAIPWDYDYLDVIPGSRDRKSTTTTTSLRLAGPLPITLPGGKPTISAHLQRTETALPGAVSYTSSDIASQIVYSVPRDIRNDAAYFEGRFPLVSPANDIPFVHSLELSVAGRYEKYRLNGSDPLFGCLSVRRPLENSDLDVECPPEGTVIPRGIASRSSFNPTYSLKWQPAADLTLRASYATGYRPQDASQLVSRSSTSFILLTDPLRGNQPIGRGLFMQIPVINNGNATLRPERSKSYTAGFILQPQQIQNLRLSVDWTHIQKRDNFYQPGLLVLGGGDFQQIFNDFIAANPDRVTRDTNPATLGGFSVGPITQLDMSLVNLAGSKVSAFDFAADYSTAALGGTLDFSLSATWAYQFEVRISDGSPARDYAGTGSISFLDTGGGQGGPEWRGHATIRYSNDGWGIGVRARSTSGYHLTATREFVAAQGAAKVPSQAYFDVFGHVRLFENTELAAGARNVFNKAPPYDSGNALRVSPYGDVRGGTYYVTLTQRF